MYYNVIYIQVFQTPHNKGRWRMMRETFLACKGDPPLQYHMPLWLCVHLVLGLRFDVSLQLYVISYKANECEPQIEGDVLIAVRNR